MRCRAHRRPRRFLARAPSAPRRAGAAPAEIIGNDKVLGMSASRTPPHEEAPASGWSPDEMVDVRDIDPTIDILDDRPILVQLPVACALSRVQASLLPNGVGLLLLDGYLAWPVAARRYASASTAERQHLPDVADSAQCAMCRGVGLEVALRGADGAPVELPPTHRPSGWFGGRDAPSTDPPTDEHARRRAELKHAMGTFGFAPVPPANAWWRYESAAHATQYPIHTASPEVILPGRAVADGRAPSSPSTPGHRTPPVLRWAYNTLGTGLSLLSRPSTDGLPRARDESTTSPAAARRGGTSTPKCTRPRAASPLSGPRRLWRAAPPRSALAVAVEGAPNSANPSGDPPERASFSSFFGSGPSYWEVPQLRMPGARSPSRARARSGADGARRRADFVDWLRRARRCACCCCGGGGGEGGGGADTDVAATRGGKGGAPAVCSGELLTGCGRSDAASPHGARAASAGQARVDADAASAAGAAAGGAVPAGGGSAAGCLEADGGGGGWQTLATCTESVSAGSIGPIFGLADEIATPDFSDRPPRQK